MTQRRALSEILTEVADAVLELASPPGLRATSLLVTLPIEIQIVKKNDLEPEFRAELPRFITRTSFDQPPDRLTVNWAEALPT